MTKGSRGRYVKPFEEEGRCLSKCQIGRVLMDGQRIIFKKCLQMQNYIANEQNS